MDRDKLRPAGGGHPRAKPARQAGLRIVERDGTWHCRGTLRVKGRKVRLRRSTGFRATEELREAAEAELLALVAKIQGDALHGIKPSVAVSVAAHRYLTRPDRKRPLGKQDVNRIKAIARKFALRLINTVKDAEWIALVDDNTAGVAAETRERYLNCVVAFLNFAKKKPRQWITELPAFERNKAARNPNRRKRRRVADLRPELLGFVIGHAAPHLKAQLAAEWSTGARVSSILQGVRVCDVILAAGRERLTFRDLKNDTVVDASLHPWAAERLREYAAWRGKLEEREAPFFLTQRRRPYTPSKDGRGGGTQNRTAFNAMKRRAITALAKIAADDDVDETTRARAAADAKLVAQITQHWFRHMMATNLLALTGGNLRMVMEQVGWLDPRSAMGYTHDVPEQRRATVAALEAPTSPSGTKKESA